MSNSNLLEVRNLNVEFATERGRIKALRDVELTIPKGKIVGVVGESGCGKSTMINSIIGLLAHNAEVTSGSITLAENSFKASFISGAEKQALLDKVTAQVARVRK